MRAAGVHRLRQGHWIGCDSRSINARRLQCRIRRLSKHRGTARGRHYRDRERDEQGENDFGDPHLYAVNYCDG